MYIYIYVIYMLYISHICSICNFHNIYYLYTIYTYAHIIYICMLYIFCIHINSHLYLKHKFEKSICELDQNK